MILRGRLKWTPFKKWTLKYIQENMSWFEVKPIVGGVASRTSGSLFLCQSIFFQILIFFFFRWQWIFTLCIWKWTFTCCFLTSAQNLKHQCIFVAFKNIPPPPKPTTLLSPFYQFLLVISQCYIYILLPWNDERILFGFIPAKKKLFSTKFSFIKKINKNK